MGKKILHINTNDSGGAAIAAIRLHKLLLNNGEDSKILFLKRTRSFDCAEVYYFEDYINNKSKFTFLFKLNNLYNRRFTFYKPKVYFNGVDSLFDVSKHPLFTWADVVHLHWVVKFVDWQKVLTKNKKVVWTCHDMNPVTGGNHYETGYNNEFKWVAKRNLNLKKKIFSEHPIVFIAPSMWMQNVIIQSRIIGNSRVHCIKNPVSTEVYKLQSSVNKEKEGKTLLFVAENPTDIRKGFSLLINAIQELKADVSIQLLVIGKQIENQMPFNCKQLGSINSDSELAEIYNQADLFLIPSIEDNLPNTVSEALLCGTPVVGFNIGGIPDMVQNLKNGVLSNSFNTLHQAIEISLNTTFDKIEIRQGALELLDEKKLFNSFIEVYNSND